MLCISFFKKNLLNILLEYCKDNIPVVILVAKIGSVCFMRVKFSGCICMLNREGD